MSNKKSAKDVAFEKERAKYRKQIRELELKLLQEEAKALRLETDILAKDSLLQEKDLWIERLLEYMDMPEDAMRKRITSENEMLEIRDRLKSLIGVFNYL